MRLRKWFLAVAGVATMATGTQAAWAQQGPQYYPAPGAPQMVSVSATSLTSLIDRIEALEASATLADEEKKEEACKEIDILAKPTQKWTGRVHLDYSGFPDDSELVNTLDGGDPAAGPDDFIGFRRLRFGTAGNINETMVYKIEMEFAQPEDPTFKDAYLGWTELPFLQTVLLGQQKRPYGLDHLNSSRYNTFMERPYVVEAFNADARRIGLQSYGVSDDERYNWRFGVFLMDDLSSAGFQRTDNYQPEIAGRFASTVWYDEVSEGRGYLHLAVSGSAAMPGRGPDDRFQTRPEARSRNRWFDTGDLDAHTYQLLGLEASLNVGAWNVTGEYQRVDVQRATANDVNFGGGYVQTSYWLTGEYTPWERDSGTIGRTKPHENFFLVRGCDDCVHRGWGAWQVAARYSYGDFTDTSGATPVFGGVGNSFTYGMNWWWNPYARVQFNYIYGDIDQRVATGTTATSGHYNIYGVRWMCDF